MEKSGSNQIGTLKMQVTTYKTKHFNNNTQTLQKKKK